MNNDIIISIYCVNNQCVCLQPSFKIRNLYKFQVDAYRLSIVLKMYMKTYKKKKQFLNLIDVVLNSVEFVILSPVT